MWKNAALFLVACLASVVLAEGILRANFDRNSLGGLKIPDPVLKHKLPAGTDGHDANDLRNPEVPDSVDILAVGDSMTYGVMARAKESWPAHLAVLTDKSVYNAGLGGYGPLQYLHMVRTLATDLKPERIIVMVYVGNDIRDAYEIAYKLEHWKDYRIEGLSVPTPMRSSRGSKLSRWLRKSSLLYYLIRDTTLRYGLYLRLKLRFAHLGRIFGFSASFLKHWDRSYLKEGSRITKRAIVEIAAFCAA